jgi:hypothetical protein
MNIQDLLDLAYTLDINLLDEKFTADQIEYNNLDFASIESTLSGVMTAYAEMEQCMTTINGLGLELAEGDAATAIKELLIALEQYISDFKPTVDGFIKLTKNANVMVTDIPNAKVLLDVGE